MICDICIFSKDETLNASQFVHTLKATNSEKHICLISIVKGKIK